MKGAGYLWTPPTAKPAASLEWSVEATEDRASAAPRPPPHAPPPHHPTQATTPPPRTAHAPGAGRERKKRTKSAAPPPPPPPTAQLRRALASVRVRGHGVRNGLTRGPKCRHRGGLQNPKQPFLGRTRERNRKKEKGNTVFQKSKNPKAHEPAAPQTGVHRGDTEGRQAGPSHARASSPALGPPGTHPQGFAVSKACLAPFPADIF